MSETKLNALGQKVQDLISAELGLTSPPAFVLIFTEPPSYDMAKFVSNCERQKAIVMMAEFANKLNIRKN